VISTGKDKSPNLVFFYTLLVVHNIFKPFSLLAHCRSAVIDLHILCMQLVSTNNINSTSSHFPMSSKSDYLKKYEAGGGNDQDKKKRKKKPPSAHVSKIAVKDDEYDANTFVSSKASTETNSIWDIGIEEQPVVVETTEDRQVSRGAWTSIDSRGVVSNTGSNRRRYDSDEEPPRARHDSDEEPPRARAANSNTGSNRRRYDSDEEPPRARHDSDEEPPRAKKAPRLGGAEDAQRRQQSSADVGGKSRPAEIPIDKSADGKNLGPSNKLVERRKKTASGHDAGLQTGAGFGRTEKEIKDRRDEEMKSGDPSLQGADQDTVYRDRKGKKLDMLNEFMRQQAVREGKEFKIEKATTEWGKGTVQKLEVEALRQELLDVASEPFARTIDNPRMEAMRKEVIRDGDPMALYFAKKKEKELEDEKSRAGSHEDGVESVLVPKKPSYKGPIGAPNRFRIMPGYRWDGIDRGNKYEHKILTKANDRTALKEDEYRWSVSDM
jgi:pre-mRNA-splicing factor CWC26